MCKNDVAKKEEEKGEKKQTTSKCITAQVQ